MADTVKKTTGKATIDAAMIVIKTKEITPKIYGFTSGQKVGVSANIETSDAIKLMIKGTLKAQKPEKKTMTGNTITITDLVTVYEMLPLLNGGELVKTEDEITGYKPPIVGEEVTLTKFDTSIYTAIMDGSTITGYECVTYPSCTGSPIGLGSEDDVFRTNEYEIISAPGQGERAYTMDIVDALPVITEQ